MARENPTSVGRRIQAELRFLGYEVSPPSPAPNTCADPSGPPSRTWRASLAAHRREIAAVDFFVVPTLTFRLLFGFVILRHDRRELLHIGVTDQPTATWAAQQIVHAFPDETGSTYLLPDRDAVYGADFQRWVERMGIRQVVIAPRAPWQNPFAQRVIGSIRRECLDLVIVLNERHPRRLLRTYLGYYNVARPHQSLGSDGPRRREVQSVPSGRIVTVPEVGELHHRYQRAA
jgi:putative transposase